MKTVKVTIIKTGKVSIKTYETEASAKQDYDYILTIFMKKYFTVELF